MGFVDDVAAAAKPKGPQCTAGLARDKLSPEDAADMEACLVDDRFTDAQVSAALKLRGLDVGAHVLGRHRRGLCQCPPFKAKAA